MANGPEDLTKGLGIKPIIGAEEPVVFEDEEGVPAQPQSINDVMISAMNNLHTVIISYVKDNGESSTREVEPVSYRRAGGRILFFGHCRLRGARRGFAVDNIQSVEETGNMFVPKPEGPVEPESVLNPPEKGSGPKIKTPEVQPEPAEPEPVVFEGEQPEPAPEAPQPPVVFGEE